MFEIPHRPDVKVADVEIPLARMGDSRVACCLQGGGVYVSSGTFTITSSSIYGNTASYVRAHVQSFPSPRWEDAPSPWETHVLLVVRRVVASMSSPLIHRSRSRCPRSTGTQRTECVLIYIISHRPDVKVADVLALTHACTTANDALVNYSMYVPQ